MSETKMPAAEAEQSMDEVSSYELAFHVLPTVAEGEVAAVVQKVKDTITKAGGALTVEEAPARVDLAYEIIKYLEGRNRKFTSAYFGWVRFTVAPASVGEIEEHVEAINELLRHLLVKLTKVEEAHPFFYHEAVDSSKEQVIDADKPADEAEESDEDDAEVDDADDASDEEDGAESEDKV